MQMRPSLSLLLAAQHSLSLSKRERWGSHSYRVPRKKEKKESQGNEAAPAYGSATTLQVIEPPEMRPRLLATRQLSESSIRHVCDPTSAGRETSRGSGGQTSRLCCSTRLTANNNRHHSSVGCFLLLWIFSLRRPRRPPSLRSKKRKKKEPRKRKEEAEGGASPFSQWPAERT